MKDLWDIASSLETDVTELGAIAQILWDMIGEAGGSGPFVLDKARHEAAVWLVGNLLQTQQSIEKQVYRTYDVAKALRKAA